MPGIAAMTDISVIGPLARSADDLSIALGLLAIPDPAETAMTYDLPAPRIKTIAGLRVAVWAADPATQTDNETTAALEALGRHLKREGARVGFTARPQFEARAAFDLYLQLLEAALSSRASPEDKERRAAHAKTFSEDDKSAAAVMARSGLIGHGEYLMLNERRHRIRRAWGAFFRDWDVLICPAFGIPAQKRADLAKPGEWSAEINGETVSAAELLFWPGLIGGFHLPATAAPLGLTRAGLPIGAQIVGPLYGDRTTIAVAGMLEKSWRAFEPPPGWT
jgi:amidase